MNTHDIEAARKQAEADFHDQREIDRGRLTPDEFERKYPNKRLYAITRASTDYLEAWVQKHAPGKVVLDYCCGLGGSSLRVLRHRGYAVGFDISAESVRTANRSAHEAGFADRSSFSVMDGEKLAFKDQAFDLIIVSGVLHHLELDNAYAELARVLRPDGRILCMEALAHNPIIDWYRRRTPKLRTAWEVDHILTVPQVLHAKRYFDSVDLRFFHLATIAAVPFRRAPFFGVILAGLELIDAVILRIPAVRRMAWQVFFELSNPRASTGLNT